MKFRLIYEGEIRPRRAASLSDVHAIRQAFHPQLERLWSYPPLDIKRAEWLNPVNNCDPNSVYARISNRGGRNYAPLIAQHLAAELDIVFLRQQPKGQLIGEGGDIDNRLKTLFDALRMPSASEVQTLADAANQDVDPLHVLLQDDSLIHRVNVETDRLLKDADTRAIVALIQVTIVVTKMTFGTISLGGA